MKIIPRGEAMRIHRQHPASRLPVVKCRIFPVCWPCLLNVVRTVLARMSG